MNSNSLLTTVLRNFQWAFKNRGYWPTMYMILDATTALLSFPFFISVSPRRTLITVPRKRFSVSSSMTKVIKGTSRHRDIHHSLIAPDIAPIPQHSILILFHDHSDPSTPPAPAHYHSQISL